MRDRLAGHVLRRGSGRGASGRGATPAADEREHARHTQCAAETHAALDVREDEPVRLSAPTPTAVPFAPLFPTTATTTLVHERPILVEPEAPRCEESGPDTP